MSYPLIACPTWAEVIQELKRHEVVLQASDGELESSDGDCQPVRYFENAKGVSYVVVFDDEHERVQISMLRALCRNFDISPSVFNLNLG